MVETGHGGQSKPVHVCPGWTGYHWEGNVLDCSIDDGVTAKMPEGILFEAGELHWVPGTRTWHGPDGELAAQYRQQSGHSALLVCETWLKRTLRVCGYSMVFGWLGEKRLVDAGSSPRLVGDWMEIKAIASLAGSRWAFGERRLERRQTR